MVELSNSLKHIFAPSSNSSENAWSKISGRVNSISRIDPKGGANSPKNNTNQQWLQSGLHFMIVGISYSKYSNQKEESTKNLPTNTINNLNHTHTHTYTQHTHNTHTHTIHTYTHTTQHTHTHTQHIEPSKTNTVV